MPLLVQVSNVWCYALHCVVIFLACWRSPMCRYVLELLKKDIKPRDIMTRAAFENAMVIVMATGGSTNAGGLCWGAVSVSLGTSAFFAGLL